MKIKAFIMVAAVVMCSASMASAANTLAVTSAAAMGGTNYGLAITFGDSASADQAYLLASTDKGFNNETTLEGEFFINPSQLTMSTTIPQHYTRILHLYEHYTNNSGVKLIFFLVKDPAGSGNWHIIVWHYNDVVSNWVMSANGFFALPSWNENKFRFRWQQGNPSSTLQMWRTLYNNGVPDASGEILMTSDNLAGMTTAAINHVFVGCLIPSEHKPGTSGILEFDEFAFRR